MFLGTAPNKHCLTKIVSAGNVGRYLFNNVMVKIASIYGIMQHRYSNMFKGKQDTEYPLADFQNLNDCLQTTTFLN